MVARILLHPLVVTVCGVVFEICFGYLIILFGGFCCSGKKKQNWIYQEMMKSTLWRLAQTDTTRAEPLESQTSIYAARDNEIFGNAEAEQLNFLRGPDVRNCEFALPILRNIG